MSFPHEVFKAYDIRGIVGSALSNEITFKIGQAVGSEVNKSGGQKIVIGRDGRLSGPELSQHLSNGLRAAGVDVVDIGVAPSPVVYYSSYAKNIPSCIAITGSHNPPNYNGFKMVVDGTTLSAESIQALKSRILADDFEQGDGGYRQEVIIPEYTKQILDDIKLERPMKIVIDCGNGVAGATAPEIFRGIGCEVIDLFSEVDGNFPNHHPDPSQAENLVDLIAAVEKNDADIGLAFDGDGDRLGVITKSGDIVWPDRQIILFAQDILARNPGAEIIYDVKCTRLLPAAIEAAGGKATMWRTGHSFIKAKLKETGAALAGEMSGHVFFKERWFGFDDGVYAGARLLEILSKSEQTPQEIFDAIPNSINTPELRIEFEEGAHYSFMDRLADVATFENAKVSTIDGLRVDYADGFGLIRPSNTTPILVLRFEADNDDAISRIQTEFKQQLVKLDPELTLPF